MASNPVVSAPNSGPIVERLKALDLLVVNDFFLSETAQLADVVLPVTQWAEEEGTMTNLEGRILRRRRLSPAPAGRAQRRPGAEGPGRSAGRRASISPPSPPPLRRAAPSEQPAASPTMPASPMPGSTPRTACSGLARRRAIPARRVCFATASPPPTGVPASIAIQHRPPAEEPDDEYPLYLTTGRLLLHYQSGTQTRRVPELAAAEPEPFVEIHPQMARQLRHRRRRAGPAAHAARHGGAQAPAQRVTARSTRSSCRSTGAVAPAPTC